MVDFAAVKREITFEQAIALCQVQMTKHGNQFRSVCPKCGGSPRTLVVTPEKGAYCFAEKKGGDVLWFVSHIRECSVKDAADFLTGHQPAVRQSATVLELPGRGNTVRETIYGIYVVGDKTYPVTVEELHQMIVEEGAT